MVAPKQTFTRPPLPLSYANQVLAIDSGVLPSVKFQVITRELQDIIVGRVKIETPSGHAFILRRFDTGSLSLTTMFRAAFPDAPEEAEKTEALYVKNAFEAPGTSGAPSGRLRLAGTWITPQCAESIAADYNLKDMISALIKAKPDPGAIYRRSTKPSSGDSPSATAVGSPPPATTTAARRSDAAPSPAGAVNKRQRVSSPHQDPPATAAALLNSRQSNRLKSPVRATPPRTSPRVSGRTPARATPTRSTPARASRGSLGATVTPMVLDEDEEPEIGGQDADEGLAEGKAIFDEVAASYNVPPSAVKSARKRSAPEQSSDEPAPALPILPNLDGPGLQVARPIASNRRINFELNAEQKALAWGTLAFAFGMGVTSFILPMLS